MLKDVLNYSYYLGVPQGFPGQLQLYVVSSAVPRVGSPLVTPQCLTCGKTTLPSIPSHYEGAATPSATVKDTYDWDEQVEMTTTEEPEPKKRRRKGKNAKIIMD